MTEENSRRKKSSKPKRQPRVGLLFLQGLFKKVRHGIVDYAQAHGGWTFMFMPEMSGSSIGWLGRANIDGAFVQVFTPADQRIARSFAFPVVNLSGFIAPRATPTVKIDDRRVGQMAAEYFFGLGFKRLGFYGSTLYYSRERHAGFCTAARQAGMECNALIVRPMSVGLDQQRQLERWLLSLRPPVGILASMDMRAAMIVDACAHIGLRVPDDVAVLGVDNDEFVCEQGPVPISSIARNDWKAGWEAAAMLDRLMSGRTFLENPVLIEPERVVTRKSTDTMPVNDPLIAGLVAGARAQLDKNFGVEWFVEHGKRSRRWIETRFRKVLGQPPAVIINKLRVDKARGLLADAKNETMKLSAIAAQCGFRDLRRFRIVFSAHAGMTPKQYRAASRAPANTPPGA